MTEIRKKIESLYNKIGENDHLKEKLDEISANIEETITSNKSNISEADIDQILNEFKYTNKLMR